MTTLAESFKGVVKELLERGEGIYSTSTIYKHDRADIHVYVKGRKFGTKDWVSGHAYRNEDGTISVCPDVMADLIGEGPFKIEDLGLCDPKMVCANQDPKTYPEYYPPPKEPPKVCPCCHRPVDKRDS